MSKKKRLIARNDLWVGRKKKRQERERERERREEKRREEEPMQAKAMRGNGRRDLSAENQEEINFSLVSLSGDINKTFSMPLRSYVCC